MSEQPLPVTWTSTLGTNNDARFIDKLIRYGGILYQCYPLNHEAEISRRPSSFIYEAIERRLLQDDAYTKAQLSAVDMILAEDKIHRISAMQTNDFDPFWNNGYFNGADAIYGYGMIVTRRPKRVLEVGVGNSTKFFRRAIKDYSLDTQLIAIDPVPRADISQIADTIIAKSVFDVELSVFDQLEPGDFLFWDGSHVVSNGSDVTRLFLEIVPRLKSGVIVHIHDITMPFEGVFVEDVGDASSPENYLVGTFILFNPSIKVILPIYYLHKKGVIPSSGCSFWFEISGTSNSQSLV
jgi:hypothetical protein